ncbi:MAG TPA: hypothetical protein VF103_14275 [Polyangiaceae bacterium]
MSSRTVRLDADSERILAELRRAKKLSVSAVLKQGLVALRESLAAAGPAATPFAVYESIDLGTGGYALGKARKAKSEIRRALKEKVRP